jgi:hypothetical protein
VEERAIGIIGCGQAVQSIVGIVYRDAGCGLAGLDRHPRVNAARDGAGILIPAPELHLVVTRPEAVGTLV